MELQNMFQKPRSISLATNILWVSWAVGLIRSVMDFFSHSAHLPTSYILNSIFGLVLAYALYLFIILKLSEGRNWARITFLVFFIIGTMTILVFSGLLLLSPAVGALYLVQFSAQAFVLFLLFTKPGSIWFRKRIEA